MKNHFSLDTKKIPLALFMLNDKDCFMTSIVFVMKINENEMISCERFDLSLSIF